MTTAASGAGDASARVFVVTGANRGIGRAVALGLARMGATVVMVCRDAGQGEAAREGVARESGNARVSLVTAELASFAAIRSAAATLMSAHPRIHGLVHNAGVHRARRAESMDGIEMTLAVNHLAPFLLTALLLPALEAAAPSRVIMVSSAFERFGPLDFRDLENRRYIGTLAYTRSKRANVLYTRALAERLAGSGVTANCVFPGLVATDLLRDRWWWRARWLWPVWQRLFLTPAEAATTIVTLATSPAFASVSGECFARGPRRIRASAGSRDVTARERLWDASARMTK